MSIAQTIGFSFMQLAYESFSTDVKQGNVPITGNYAFSQLAYESFSTDVKQGNVPITGNYAFSQLAYESYTKDGKSTYLDYPFALNELYMRAIYNPVFFAFLGKAWLFDGSTLVEFSSPFKAVFPMVATDNVKIFAGGGMMKDMAISGHVYGFGLDAYRYTADRFYLAVVLPSGAISILDEKGNIVALLEQQCVIPIRKMWRLTSRVPFDVYVMRIE